MGQVFAVNIDHVGVASGIEVGEWFHRDFRCWGRKEVWGMGFGALR
jgi:hypothetical protein